MNNHTALETLRTFRAAVYVALGRERNELLDLMDANLCAGPVPSLAHLSVAAPHRGGHGRLYRALAQVQGPAQVDVPALRRIVAAQPLAGGDATANIFAIDASPWPRPDAATSAERGFCHHASRHSHGQPVVPGWNYQWLAEVRLTHESWTAPLAVERVPPGGNVNATACAQVQRLLPAWYARCPATPLVVFDAGYDAVQLGVGLAAAVAAGHVALLVRVRSNRCFYADPPPRSRAPHHSVTATAPGRPRVHGARFACADPRTWWAPTRDDTSADPQYGTVRVRAWAGVHGIPREHRGRVRRVPGGDAPDRRGKVPIVRGTLLLVEVERLPRRTHAPKPLWLFWQGAGGSGPGQPDVARLWQAYVRRFALEHTFRFCKQTLNWVLPRLRTPAQADRWTWLVLLAYTQLRLARPLVGDHRLPWQRPLPPERLTPGRVRQGLSAIWMQVGSPADAPQPRGRSPGRPRGRRSRRATRFAVVKAPT